MIVLLLYDCCQVSNVRIYVTTVLLLVYGVSNVTGPTFYFAENIFKRLNINI